MLSTLSLIEQTHLIAIVRMAQYDQALEVAQALVAGGIRVIEFTLTGVGATAAIASTCAALRETALIGAGTVLTPCDVQEVAAAGAKFVVTPVLNTQVIEACQRQHTPIVCGALTPSEIQTAHEAGAELIKVFPARQFGPQYLRDVLAPLPHARLVPTGGIDLQNAPAYLEAGAVAVGMGGNLVSAHAVATRDWAHITHQARACIQAITAATPEDSTGA